MANLAQAPILDALTRAAAAPDGLPLVASKGALFTATSTGRSAAQRCKDDGLLRVLRSEARGKTQYEICIITDKGLGQLLRQSSPRPVLEALVAALGARQQVLGDIVERLRQSQVEADTLAAVVRQVLDAVREEPAASKRVAEVVCAELARWRDSGSLDDCPLPELQRRVTAACPRLSLGQFHDVLRDLHHAGKVYLHPWTGPLYDLPEPGCALLIGHALAYYASLREVERVSK